MSLPGMLMQHQIEHLNPDSLSIFISYKNSATCNHNRQLNAK